MSGAAGKARFALPLAALLGLLLFAGLVTLVGVVAWAEFAGAPICTTHDAAKTQVSMFNDAIAMYTFHLRRSPAGLEDLIREPDDPSRAGLWDGPYLSKQALPSDPWDHPYRYMAAGEHNKGGFDVWSVGPDGVSHTRDDIGNW